QGWKCMRSKSDKKKSLVPRLRFPEFREAGAWEVKRLGDVCEVLDNLRKPVARTKRNPGPYPYYGASGAIDYIDQYIFDERLLLIGEDGAKWLPYEKTAFIVEGQYWVNNHAHVLRPTLAIDTLLENYLTALDISQHITGAAPPKLTLDNLRLIWVPLPPKRDEQQKIAHCLSSLDEVIGLQAKKVQALKQHKKGLMQQLFPAEGETTPRLRFPEFREAGAWEVKRLGEVADVVAAGDLNVDDYSTERTDKYIFPIYSNSVAKKGLYGFCATPKYKENSVTVTARGTLGVAFHRNCNFAAIGRLLVISNLNVVNPYFLQEIWNHSVQLPLEDGGIPQLTAVKAKPAKVAFPRNTHEQQKIAHCLSSLDEVIGLESHKLDALKNLKKGLMQQLFPQEVA
ncbi:restriction endonuclease subunit S, partial [Thiolapillus sp.]|uniref:restriction endonuclease subunit S n=4 Tax=Thiolapillus sp. TaxID=2017437 RepID=UPI003AF604A0